MPMGLCSTDIVALILILTVPLETNYLRMYWTDLHQTFRIGTYDTDGHDQSYLLVAIAQGTSL